MSLRKNQGAHHREGNCALGEWEDLTQLLVHLQGDRGLRRQPFPRPVRWIRGAAHLPRAAARARDVKAVPGVVGLGQAKYMAEGIRPDGVHTEFLRSI
jgi:hypothetical protein